MKLKKTEPDWVCFDCASERGAYMPHDHVYTANINVCGLCKQTKEVTEPRDYGKTRNLLKI